MVSGYGPDDSFYKAARDRVITFLKLGDREVTGGDRGQVRVTISDTLNNPSTQARQAFLLILLSVSILSVSAVSIYCCSFLLSSVKSATCLVNLSIELKGSA